MLNTINILGTWFSNYLIPGLEPNTAIVLDKAPYHSRLVEKMSNKSGSKSGIKNFLINYDLYIENAYTKEQLLAVLKTKTFG